MKRRGFFGFLFGGNWRGYTSVTRVVWNRARKTLTT